MGILAQDPTFILSKFNKKKQFILYAPTQQAFSVLHEMCVQV